MVSIRLPLLLLFIALATHVVNACVRIEKGNKKRIITSTKSFQANLPPNQDSVVVDVSPFGLGTEVSGVEVEACLHSFTENANIRVSYKDWHLSFERQSHDDSSADVDFSITVYYVPVVPDAEFLEEGTVGFYEGN